MLGPSDARGDAVPCGLERGVDLDALEIAERGFRSELVLVGALLGYIGDANGKIAGAPSCSPRPSTLQEISNTQRGCPFSEVRVIEPITLHLEDAENVTPLTIGYFVSHPEPNELVEQRVLG